MKRKPLKIGDQFETRTDYSYWTWIENEQGQPYNPYTSSSGYFQAIGSDLVHAKKGTVFTIVEKKCFNFGRSPNEWGFKIYSETLERFLCMVPQSDSLSYKRI